MARTGLYKSEVKQARDALTAQGVHPSVDAVRVALGNTGSKTTIHKYLKELGEDDGGADSRKTSISEALQHLVERLAAQLHDEANARIDAIHTESADKARLHVEAQTALHKEVETLSGQVQRADMAAHQEAATHDRTRELLQQETIARHTLEQQVSDLKERLAENEAHRLSIEDKHRHAREALEHYRASVKEQRDQDQRRHEQQIQQLQAELRQLQQTAIVKQEEVTRLNQEGARLVADLSHAQKTLYDQQAQGRQLQQRLEALQAVEQRCSTQEAKIKEKDAEITERKSQAADTAKQAAAFSEQVHRLELELAGTHAKLTAQQTIADELRNYLARLPTAEEKATAQPPATSAPAAR